MTLLLAAALLAAQPIDRAAMAARVKAEFVHAWHGYETYAWGHDELRPLSKSWVDWYGQPLLMTPVDALDTMLIMGLDDEAEKTKQLIVDRLSFDKDISVKNFEITIRLLGGLLSSYEMTGDPRLLKLADDLGTRLLPVFESKTGMPYVCVNLKTGAADDELSNPAEVGTLILEFGTLSRLTHKPVYFEKAKKALVQLYDRRSKLGLVGEEINVNTGWWVSPASHVGGGIDSYYEYLLKCSRLFGDGDCSAMWDRSLRALNSCNIDTSAYGLWYGEVDMRSGARTAAEFGALNAFLPAVLALGGDLRHAEELENSCFEMWNDNAVEPDLIDYRSMEVLDAYYPLRPEIIESAYYLYHYTRDPRYLEMGRTFFDDLVTWCRTDDGYAMLKNVATKEKADLMPSYFLAETLKYLYLLFSDDNVIDFDRVVFNTEAHPLRRPPDRASRSASPAIAPARRSHSAPLRSRSAGQPQR